jgi:hypothetical protein
MKVSQLIKHLKNFDGDLEVVMSKDREGNHYSPLDGISGFEDVYTYTPDGRIHQDKMMPPKGFVPCMVIWPKD